METFAFYLIKSSVWLTVFTFVYALFLRNERYFTLNRIFLVSGIFASFLFPLYTWHYTVILPLIPSVGVSDPIIQGISVVDKSISLSNILMFLYISGVIVLLFKIIRQTLPVIRIINKSEVYINNQAKLIRTADYPSSFSFISYVFVNPSIDEIETREIVNHETEHIRQKHWIDLLLFELLCTIQWFNPLIWLYGRFIRQNHEYLADEFAIKRSSNPAIYRAALLNQMFGGPVIVLANSFNYSLNKKRFNMMTKTINSPIRKLKLLLVLPFIIGVFYAFAAPEYKFSQLDPAFLKDDAKPVSGQVISEDGKPLKGVAIVVSGKTMGTTTDGNGTFELILTDDTPLVFSYVGLKTVRISPDFGNRMNVKLEKENIILDFDKTEPGPVETKSSIMGENTVYYIDGIEKSKKDIDNINPNSIKSISVLKDESAVKKYGEKAKNGVVEIFLKNEGDSKVEVKNAAIAIHEINGSKVEGTKASNNFMLRNSGLISDANPLLVVDGNISENKNIDSINPETIQSVNVLKGEPAIAKYGEKAKNGVLEITLKQDKPVFFVVEEMPEFPGGQEALRKFIANEVKYPVEAQEKAIQGKVFVNFVVSETGVVKDAKIARGVDPIIDNEALRVVNNLPAWKPGKQKGVAVNVSYTVPINFSLEPAQTAKPAEKQVFFIVEEMPEYPGGKNALFEYISKEIKYPAVAKEKGIQGKVFINFIVSANGSVKNAKVSRGVDPSIDMEALRVVNSLPNWKPGKQKGEAVDVSYTIPINFSLINNTVSKDNSAKKEAAQNLLVIVPNPAKDQITVALKNIDQTTDYEVSVFDRFGKLMITETKKGASFNMSVSKLITGTYYMVVKQSQIQITGYFQVVK